MLKKEVAKLTVGDVLNLIYNHQLIESSIKDLPKEKLEDYILEIFNKGILQDYLSLSSN